MFAAVCFLALLAANEGFFIEMPHFSLRDWLAVLFIGVSSGVGYHCWLWPLGHATPTRVTVFLSLGPITAALPGTQHRPAFGERMPDRVVPALQNAAHLRICPVLYPLVIAKEIRYAANYRHES